MARGLDLSRLALPGQDWRQHTRFYFAVMLTLSVVSLFLLPPYLNERQALLERGQHYVSTAELLNHFVAYPGMPPFWTLARRFLTPFPCVAAVYLLYGAVNNFLRCRSGARSDYTLRRLRDPWEYRRRCFALPVLAALLCLLLFALLTGVYYAIYLRFTPPEWLPPAGQRFWG